MRICQRHVLTSRCEGIWPTTYKLTLEKEKKKKKKQVGLGWDENACSWIEGIVFSCDISKFEGPTCLFH